MPAIPAFQKWREDNYGFETSMSYIASSRPEWARPCLKNKTKQPQN
jgi:hypothetical protein